MNIFGYHCGIQANTKYSPFMALTRCTPMLTIDINLNGLCDVFDEFSSLEVMAEHMQNIQLIVDVQRSLLENVKHV
jgi:hypothetical protein